MTLIELPNNPFDAGVLHGRECAEAIQSFIRDDLARINSIRASPIARHQALSLLQAHADIVIKGFPALAQEIQGLARGAEISQGEAFLLQFRRELIASRTSSVHGCSVLATKLDKSPILAQTMDLEGNVCSLVRLFRCSARTDGSPASLIVSLAGLLGFVGMNDRGLCIGINMIFAPPWVPGISPYLLVKHLLTFKTIDECLRQIPQIRVSSSRSLVLLQGSRCVNIEMTSSTYRLTERFPLTHTNHFLHPDLLPVDLANPLSKSNSHRRLAYLEQYVQSCAPREVDDVFQVLSDHSLYPRGICMHGEGAVKHPDTVAAVVFHPTARALFVRIGHPCNTKTITLAL